MYLTKSLIKYEMIAKRHLHNRGRLHQIVWECFPHQPEKNRNFLFRMEETDKGIKFLILSKEIPTRPNWCPTQEWGTKPIPQALFDFPSYRFKLTLNATKKLECEDKNRRSPILDPEELQKWLAYKGKTNGFKLEENISIRTERKQPFQYKDKTITIAFTEVEGRLTITNKENFKEIFEKGIGRAKGFGTGMFVLLPEK